MKCPECGKEVKNEKKHREKHKSEIGKSYTFIDLFAGIGGFHLAFHDLGARCVFASEWNDYARKTYEENFKNVSPNLFNEERFAGDIREIKESEIPDFDILAAGFPCQAFSQAGYKKGFEDARGTLFFEIARILKAKQPKAFFLENVRHLKNHDDGKTFEIIKKILTEDLGYSFYFKVVKASDYGLPQRRPRLFMVGFKNHDIEFKFPEPTDLNKTVSDILRGDCEKDVGYTLRVGGRKSGIDDRRNWDAYRVDGEVVVIGPEEGKEFMGFPTYFKLPVSETQAMKQLGNSVAVTAVKMTAEEIIKSLNNYYA